MSNRKFPSRGTSIPLETIAQRDFPDFRKTPYLTTFAEFFVVGTWTSSPSLRQVKSRYSMYLLFTIPLSYVRILNIDLKMPC
jgi:hypothetical protein